MKTEYAQEVAAKIIEQLEQGTAPWQKPWKPGELSLPYNAVSGKEYRGINSMWLSMQGHADPRWMTYNQAGEAGAQVRHGSKGTKIIYWKFREERKATDDNGKPILDDNGKPKMVTVELERPRAFHAVVFNAEQIDGLPALEPKQIRPEPERHAQAEAILANSGATIRNVPGDRAYYQPSTDSITLPERGQFDTQDGYYATALHELGHWTGHPARLDRDLAHPFGSEGYAREELRAEISSLMVGERLDIGHDPGQHAAYVGSWVKALKEDPREIFRAAADAEKIASYVLAFEKEQVQENAHDHRNKDALREHLRGVRSHIVMTQDDPAVVATAVLHVTDAQKAIDDGDLMTARASLKAADLKLGGYEQIAAALGMLDDIEGKEQGQTQEQAQELPAGWTETHPGGMATNPDPERGGIVDTNMVSGQWFYVPHREGLAASEAIYPSRAAALEGLAELRLTDPPTQAHPAAVRHHPPENPMPERTYLAVPFAEKEQAKGAAQNAGFKLQWDKENKAWFAPAGADLSNMERWKADGPRVQTPTIKSAEGQFGDALRAAGLVVDGLPVMDGKIHRVPVEGDRGGETSGAYAGHMAGRIPGGYIENYKTGERINWKAEGTIAQTTPEERAKLAAEAAQRQQRRDTETADKHERTAAAAAALWAEAPAATAANAYCKAKGIAEPVGLRVVTDAASPEAASKGIQIAKTAKQAKAMRDANPEALVFKAGDLLIPGRDADGKLWTLQSVNPSFKSFMKGGRKHGLFAFAGVDPQGSHSLGTLLNDGKPLLIAEGYATADAVSRMAGQPVVVAFDSGNLDAVARELRERFPTRPMLIAADNDHNAPKQPGPDGKPRPNVGLEKAKQASEKYGAGVAAPPFKDGEKGSDWNDLRDLRGEESARKLLAEQLAVAKRDAAITAERLTTLAHERDQEARNDATTSADDARVASERDKAAEMITTASEQNSAVRSSVADSLTSDKKGVPAAAAAKAGIDRKTATMHDEAKRERQDVQNRAPVNEGDRKHDATAQPPAKAPRSQTRARSQGAEL